MPGSLTAIEVIKLGIIHEERVNAAVAAVLANPRIGHVAIADALVLNLARIVRFTSAAQTMRDPTASNGLKRGVLLKAILLARPSAP